MPTACSSPTRTTISFDVRGAGRLVGLDNGREEDAENYKASTREAFNGKALAIVASSNRPGPITVTATADGLVPARSDLLARAHGATERHRARARAYVGDGHAGGPPPRRPARRPTRATRASPTRCRRP